MSNSQSTELVIFDMQLSYRPDRPVKKKKSPNCQTWKQTGGRGCKLYFHPNKKKKTLFQQNDTVPLEGGKGTKPQYLLFYPCHETENILVTHSMLLQPVFSLLQKVIFLLLRRKCLPTHWFIRHSPGWDISLRLALVLPCAMISFQGEGIVHSGGDFPHQQTPLSLESHTHHLLECTILRLIIAVFFSTHLFPSLPTSHLPIPHLMHADLHLVSP